MICFHDSSSPLGRPISTHFGETIRLTPVNTNDKLGHGTRGTAFKLMTYVMTYFNFETGIEGNFFPLTHISSAGFITLINRDL